MCLKIALVCLSYDFIGTTLDEASEELGTIQVFAVCPRARAPSAHGEP